MEFERVVIDKDYVICVSEKYKELLRWVRIEVEEQDGRQEVTVYYGPEWSVTFRAKSLYWLIEGFTSRGDFIP